MLNAKKLSSASNNARLVEPLPPGSYPARLVQIVGFGVQKQRMYKGEEKPPQLTIRLTYEMLDEFMKDDDGNDILDKPRWLSEELPFLPLKADLAKSTKRYFALDPEDKADGDWAKLIATPCMVTVVNEKDKRPGIDRTYEKISAVSAMRLREAAKAPELKNPSLVWDFYEPDMAKFEKMPDWIQQKMKDAVDYEGSALQTALGGPDKEVDSTNQRAVKAPVGPADEAMDNSATEDGNW